MLCTFKPFCATCVLSTGPHFCVPWFPVWYVGRAVSPCFGPPASVHLVCHLLSPLPSFARASPSLSHKEAMAASLIGIVGLLVGRGLELVVERGAVGGRMKGKYSHDHLLATQERVADELASSQGNGGIGVRHLDRLVVSTCRNAEISRFDCGWWAVDDEGGRRVWLAGQFAIQLRSGQTRDFCGCENCGVARATPAMSYASWIRETRSR